MDEFALIRRYFAAANPVNNSVVCGIGDDVALLKPTAGMQLVVCTDTLVAGRHFLPDANPADVGWKSLAVNLSDLAAMGAQPRWCLLALTLPQADESWLAGFSSGLKACADAHGVDLVGGDTTRGPLTITVTALGEVLPGEALRRDGAQAGDLIAVTGPLGNGAAGLALARGALQHRPNEQQARELLVHYNRPAPRVAAGLALAGLATAAIDVSDGLVQDLQHVLTASNVGARLDVSRIPASAALQSIADKAQCQAWQLSGGDDYELLVTIAPERLETAQDRLRAVNAPPLQVIGEVVANLGLVDGETGTTLSAPGFSHF